MHADYLHRNLWNRQDSADCEAVFAAKEHGATLTIEEHENVATIGYPLLQQFSPRLDAIVTDVLVDVYQTLKVSLFQIFV